MTPIANCVTDCAMQQLLRRKGGNVMAQQGAAKRKPVLVDFALQ